MINVHYVFDPMCGWCYGATSLIDLLHRMEGIHLTLHPGGMMEATPIGTGFRQHILEADKRIESQTGQAFGTRYLEKVASGETLVLDSFITAQAIMATELLGWSGVDMLRKIQFAHYVDGLPVYQSTILSSLAGQLGIGTDAWEDAMDKAKANLEAEITHTRELMNRFGLGGFPSLVFEADDQWHTLSISRFYGRPQEWQDFWTETLRSTNKTAHQGSLRSSTADSL